jgi:tetratricopeptide (TPR) repeat protein
MLIRVLLLSFAFGQDVSDSLRSDSQSIYYAPANVLRFAEYLRDMGDDARAIGEYERYLLWDPAHPASDVYFQVGECYMRLQKYEDAARSFGKALSYAARSSLQDSADVARATAFLLAGDDTAFGEAIAGHFADSNSVALTRELAGLRTLSLLRDRTWGEALRASEVRVSRDADSTFLPLASLARRGLELPHKAPALAASLSAVLPGSGKMYSGRIADGVYSLLIIGSCSWLAYEGFRDDGVSSGKGWWFGSSAAFFYAGNVYGSLIAARRYNRNAEERLRNDVRLQFDYWIRF